jgi:hypothetical protein
LLGLDVVIVKMFDFYVVVSQNFVSDDSFSREASRSKHILNTLDFNVQTLSCELMNQEVVKLETTKYWLLIDFVIRKVQ